MQVWCHSWLAVCLDGFCAPGRSRSPASICKANVDRAIRTQKDFDFSLLTTYEPQLCLFKTPLLSSYCKLMLACLGPYITSLLESGLQG